MYFCLFVCFFGRGSPRKTPEMETKPFLRLTPTKLGKRLRSALLNGSLRSFFAGRCVENDPLGCGKPPVSRGGRGESKMWGRRAKDRRAALHMSKYAFFFFLRLFIEKPVGVPSNTDPFVSKRLTSVPRKRRMLLLFCVCRAHVSFASLLPLFLVLGGGGGWGVWGPI